MPLRLLYGSLDHFVRFLIMRGCLLRRKMGILLVMVARGTDRRDLMPKLVPSLFRGSVEGCFAAVLAVAQFPKMLLARLLFMNSVQRDVPFAGVDKPDVAASLALIADRLRFLSEAFAGMKRMKFICSSAEARIV